MKLQRYDLLGEYEVEMLPYDAGDYVKLSEALDWFESLLEPIRVPCATLPIELHALAVNEERARLRALIAAERGKV